MGTNLTSAGTVGTATAPATASVGRVLLTGLGAAIAAAVINVILGQLALLLGAAKLPMLTPPPLVVFTLVGLIGATVVFLLLRRFTKNAAPTFRIVAAVVLVLSFIPDFLLLGATATGALWLTVATLLITHIVAAAIIVGTLTGFNRGAGRA